MYIMNYDLFELVYDKNKNQKYLDKIEHKKINDHESIIEKLLEFSITGVESVDNFDDIDISYELNKFYSSEWLNTKELSYDNCVWLFYKDDENRVYKEVYSFEYEEKDEV